LLGHPNAKTTTRYVLEYPVRLKALYDVAFNAGCSCFTHFVLEY
jgi:hypothetical protein